VCNIVYIDICKDICKDIYIFYFRMIQGWNRMVSFSYHLPGPLWKSWTLSDDMSTSTRDLSETRVKHKHNHLDNLRFIYSFINLYIDIYGYMDISWYIWLVVDLPLWKMMEWKSVGMMIPNIWKNKKRSKTPICSAHPPLFCDNSQFYQPGSTVGTCWRIAEHKQHKLRHAGTRKLRKRYE
jgi:hypothetical protein